MSVYLRTNLFMYLVFLTTLVLVLIAVGVDQPPVGLLAGLPLAAVGLAIVTNYRGFADAYLAPPKTTWLRYPERLPKWTQLAPFEERRQWYGGFFIAMGTSIEVIVIVWWIG